MSIVLLSSAVLVILPIFFVQYQRFLASLHHIDPYLQLRSLPVGLQLSHQKKDIGYDGTASDSASEGPSEAHQRRVATPRGYERKESRKPWDPPFPMRAKTVRGSYLVLPKADEENDEQRGKRKGKECERSSTSQVSPDEEDEEDGLANLGHLPVTDPPSYSAPVPVPSVTHLSTPSKPAHIVEQQKPTEQSPPVQPAPEGTPAAAKRTGSLSLVQTIILILAFIISIFAFAVLVAHCMAWFIVYKTEARLGEVRKGLLRGGDMRVCLCAR